MCVCSVRDQQSVTHGTDDLSQQEPKCGWNTDQQMQLSLVLSCSHLWSDANQLPNWRMQRTLSILKHLNTVSWLRSKTRAENWKHAFIRLHVCLYLRVYLTLTNPEHCARSSCILSCLNIRNMQCITGKKYFYFKFFCNFCAVCVQ